MSAEQVTTAVAVLEVVSAQPGGDVVLAYRPEPAARPVQLTMPHDVWVAMGNPNSLSVTVETRCDGCGCTDSQGCFLGCTWAAPGLCSSCVDAPPAERKSLWERFDDARGEESTGDPINSRLTWAAWTWLADRLGDQDVIDAFKVAWETADSEGRTGSRVAAGLRAVAQAVRKP